MEEETVAIPGDLNGMLEVQKTFRTSMDFYL